jgi:uncharacterized paraquat-inducible protein A
MKDTIICQECESEFRVEELESDYEVCYCPFCGEPLTENDDGE